MIVNMNMFNVGMIDVILGKFACGIVIAIYSGCKGRREAKAAEELLKEN